MELCSYHSQIGSVDVSRCDHYQNKIIILIFPVCSKTSFLHKRSNCVYSHTVFQHFVSDSSLLQSSNVISPFSIGQNCFVSLNVVKINSLNPSVLYVVHIMKSSDSYVTEGPKHDRNNYLYNPSLELRFYLRKLPSIFHVYDDTRLLQFNHFVVIL